MLLLFSAFPSYLTPFYPIFLKFIVYIGLLLVFSWFLFRSNMTIAVDWGVKRQIPLCGCSDQSACDRRAKVVATSPQRQSTWPLQSRGPVVGAYWQRMVGARKGRNKKPAIKDLLTVSSALAKKPARIKQSSRVNTDMAPLFCFVRRLVGGSIAF